EVPLRDRVSAGYGSGVRDHEHRRGDGTAAARGGDPAALRVSRRRPRGQHRPRARHQRRPAPALGLVRRRGLGARGGDEDERRRGQSILPGRGERGHGHRPPPHQDLGRRQEGAVADSHHQARLRPLSRARRGALPAPRGV
ncbi:MAG: hypothetical protein AVDCRST_MAG17-1178, partial [uncultured Solirubrobacterales bacterium]